MTALLLSLQSVLLGIAAYNAVIALWGWPRPRRVPVSPRGQRFRVVIPAHDEGAVVAAAVADLRAQDYPGAREVWVIADRCGDDTAAVAAGAGARVAERTDGDGGKGAALTWYLERHPLAPDECLVVVDADNRVPDDLLARFADEIAGGAGAVQAYLDISNPDASPLATAGAVSYWASNRMVQQARHRLGWSADLGGTGMALTVAALDAAGGFGDSLTEDADLGVRLSLAGITVRWLHDLRVRDEKPTSVSVTVRQRARWAAGKRAVGRRHAGHLVMRAIRTRSLGAFDMALRLVQPSRTIVAAASGVAWVVAAVWAPEWLWPAPVWAIATTIQLLQPIPFLIRDGVPARYVVRYPLLVLLALLWIPIRIASRLTRGWYHTPHGQSGS